MANLTQTPGWDAIPQIEINTPVRGGPGGEANRQAQALLNRFALLETIEGSGKIRTADGRTVEERLLAASIELNIEGLPAQNPASGAAFIFSFGGVRYKTTLATLLDIIDTEILDQAVAAAQTARDAAIAAQTAAEAAADSAILDASRIFLNTAAGLAATTNGQYFYVVGASANEALILYRNDAGVATEIKRLPSSVQVTANTSAIADHETRIDTLEANTGAIQVTPGPDYLPDGTEPLGYFAALGPDGLLYNLLAFMPDGTIRSESIEALIAAQLGGLSYSTITSEDWGSFVIGQMGPDGLLYALAGVDAQNQFYAPGIGGGNSGSMELLHIPMLGQSNLVADESAPVLSSAATGWGNYKFARGVLTWSSTDNPTTPASRAASGFAFNALTATGVETRANGMADALKALKVGASRFSGLNHDVAPRFLISTSALGGRKLTELGPEDDGASGRPGARTPGGHWPTMLDDITRGKAQALSLGFVYQVPAWIYDQGESEGDLTLYFGEAARTPQEIIDGYASRALTMAQTFDSAVRTITGQTRPIPLFVTPACSNLLTPTAWRQVADASDLVFLVGPRYQMPSAINTKRGTGPSQVYADKIHYTPDGHRWIGELCAKVLHRVLQEGENWKPLQVLKATKFSATQIDVKLHVPRPPLVIDTETIIKIVGWGFSIFSGGINAPTGRLQASAIEILPGGDTLRLTFSSIAAGAKLSVGFNASVDFAIAGSVFSIAAGAATPDGFPTTDITLSTDITATLAPLSAEGAFAAFGPNPSSVTVRGVSTVSGKTVLNVENREINTTPPFSNFDVGDSVTFGRIFAGTNIRDSDEALALNTHSTGPKAGQLYDLRNWLCQQDNITIIGA